MMPGYTVPDIHITAIVWTLVRTQLGFMHNYYVHKSNLGRSCSDSYIEFKVYADGLYT